MSNEERKEQIRRRLKLSAYPRRGKAVFTEENDHNPRILEDCPRCYGTGNVDIHQSKGNEESWSLETCPVCSGTGITEEVVAYFENNSPAIEANANTEGWVKCPSCGWKFALKDSNVWTGRRHKRCGQKLNIV